MNADAGQARAMLGYLSPYDHETRYRVGMALYAGLGEDGYELFDQWLSRHDKYRSELRSWGRSHWRGLSRGSGGRGIGFGTLVHMAREAGWQGDYRPRPLSQADRRAAAAARRAQEEARRDASANARNRAYDMLRRATLEHHPYLEQKGFPTEQGLVLNDLLLIPIRSIVWSNQSGALRSLQTIDGAGEKRYLFGSDLSGGGMQMGSAYPRDIYYVEGFATALTIRAALRTLPGPQWAVVACMSAAGLAQVASRHGRGTRKRPRRGFVIADHDDWLCRAPEGKPHRWVEPVGAEPVFCPTCGEPERMKRPAGEAAALRSGLPWTAPGDRGDANDLHQADGLEVVRQMIVRLRSGRTTN